MSRGARGTSQGRFRGKDKKEDVNILILGETGVGKSTWINGIVNYAKHETLQDAMNDREFTVLIPSRFIFMTEEGEEKVIKVGSGENEVLVDGQSATQHPKEYVIETNTTKFHLIDTPGIGDCRGYEQDKKNFDNILAFLTDYDKINAVVVLLKPNSSRLTVAFKFCVLELMTHLHKSVVSNIVFAFTNSRGTFYRPGDTLPSLKKLLKENNIEIDVSPKSCFCFDNEAFRFLACVKSGVELTADEAELYSQSWIKSCETTGKLFQFATNMQPHETKKTLSLNEARSCIIAMSKPMAEAVQLIRMNVNTAKQAKEECNMEDNDIKKFEKRLKFKGFDLEIKKIDYPRTVCTADGCKKRVAVGESKTWNTVYPQICHPHCNLDGVPVETTNNEQLRGCAAMSGGGNCGQCGHNYRVHMHITYIADLVEKEFLSKEVQDLIRQKANFKSQKEVFIAVLETRIKELEEEKEIISESASFFGVFLKENALIPYNDSFREYLDMLIREEEGKEKPIRDDNRIEQLKIEKKAYEEKTKVIIKSITSGYKDRKEVLPIEEVEKRRQKLCSLKHNGETLNKALAVVISSRKTSRKSHREKSAHVVSAKSSLFHRAWIRAKSYVLGSKSTKRAPTTQYNGTTRKYSKRLHDDFQDN